MINPQWLRTFCSLVETRHFTETARQLNMTQPGVSQHIQKLESHLNVCLIIRSDKKFVITDAGQRLYDSAVLVLSGLQDLERVVLEDFAFSGRVRVASPGSIGLRLYGRMLELQKENPQLLINYKFAPNSEIEQLVYTNIVDIGIMTAVPKSLDVTSMPIGSEKLLLVTPANIRSVPKWQDLIDLGFINHPDGSYHASLLLGSNYKEFSSSSVFEEKGFSNQIGLILLPVSMGLGFTVLPEYAVKSFANRQDISIFELREPVSEKIYLIHHGHKPLARRMRTVIQSIKELLQDI